LLRKDREYRHDRESGRVDVNSPNPDYQRKNERCRHKPDSPVLRVAEDHQEGEGKNRE
jgi:hypothetical protein